MAAEAKPEEEFAELKFPDGRVHKLRIFRPTLGDQVFLDIRDLHAKTNSFTYDPGFTSTGACQSAITFVDGDNGVCLYRGYPVQELVNQSSALEVAYLILTGELPTECEYKAFQGEIMSMMLVHEKIKVMFGSFPLSSHPMAILVSVTGALATFFHELDPFNESHRWQASIRLVAKMPVLACMAYKTSIGEPIMYPKAHLSFAENFLYMMFATPLEEYKVNKTAAKAIDAFFILHADHEQNASTSTVRIAGSSQANPYACVAAGVACLWGPAHGGANEAVIQMLTQIGKKENIPQFIEDVKNKKAGVRLMGFGHRVYKNYDPRARVMGQLTKQVLAELKIDDPNLEIAVELERIALSDEYFVKRKLYPNVDFYSGIMLRALNIPTSMFTVMFAMARTIGWITQWKEMLSEKQLRIGRPRQLYVGEKERAYVPEAKRSIPEPEAPEGVPKRDSLANFGEDEGEATKAAEPAHNRKALFRRTSSFKMKVDDLSAVRPGV